MSTRWSSVLIALVLVVLVTGCGTANPGGPTTAEPPTSTPTAAPVLMPDLGGLTSGDASTRLVRLNERTGLRVTSDWRTTPTRCGARPGTVLRQHPGPGTVLERGTEVRAWTASIDLTRFRGPCDPTDGDFGPTHGADARLARAFYRFAADPSLGAPYVDGDVWTGIEGGPPAAWVPAADRGDLDSWQLDASYAERVGPFSALDTVALSGGYYELHGGVVQGCPSGDGSVSPEMAGLRALSLTAPSDTVGSCLDSWAVTLFLDDADRIAGVSLSLGSP